MKNKMPKYFTIANFRHLISKLNNPDIIPWFHILYNWYLLQAFNFRYYRAIHDSA